MTQTNYAALPMGEVGAGISCCSSSLASGASDIVEQIRSETSSP
jgi:hypothetical protein